MRHFNTNLSQVEAPNDGGYFKIKFSATVPVPCMSPPRVSIYERQIACHVAGSCAFMKHRFL